ncbi:outer membrane beta-barrel protein [Mucilaginibacter polytrichastri]|uniref:Outer membrane protein beta-barrel domain-containing protein n=1 Tax=Mucilaginibacter polytrichastri TaxID=1302689 RepID=A0A1Q6A485_9SPHI|nr:outer membrane beta-barrel protein [Mucilaginibacter polytrichastri]OKS88825.1 hypothetical protein RG47T_4303 [Mucilaginibacter polytrichastri]SFT06152.1 CarboxypepD_reg-like domain-containing protein [Mucilaginibacter polytrichastri]
MKLKFYLIIIFCFLVTARASAQKPTGSIHTVVVDQKQQPLEYVNAVVVNAADSVAVKSTASNKQGSIEITGLKQGSYKLIVSQLGLKRLVRPFAISNQKPTANLGTLTMEPDVHNLNEVAVSAVKANATIKGDTTEFNARAFKTQPNDNVEQLLKKLPGVEVDKDGKVTAQGQQVTKILVDGKEFFGNDPKAVTKNLPADAIDKIQIISDKTEKAKNTGIDDGQREKVMNVTLKDDKKSGWFGNVSAAGGTDSKYLGQFNINHFDNKRQLSALFLSNNVNESGFTMEDLNAFTGGNVFDTFSNNGSISINVNSNGRANINGAFAGVNGGLITNHTGGLNYSDMWGKKNQLKFNANFITVLSSNNLAEVDNIQDPVQNLLTNKNINGNNRYNSYRLNMNLEYKPDTLNTLKLKPNLSYSYTHSNNVTGITSTDLNQTLLNNASQSLDQVLRNPVLGAIFSANHKFQHGKGSINLYTTDSYSPYRNKATNIFNIAYPTNSTVPDSTANLQTAQNNNGTISNTTLSFIRQLSKAHKLNLTLSQGFNYRNDNASQTTIDYNPVTGRYEILAPNLSGIYDNTNYRYSSTAGLSKSGAQTTVSLNAELADLGLRGNFTGAQASSVNRNDWALVPNASFSYHPKVGPSIYLSVRSDVTMPSVTDLLPIINTTSNTYKKIGNPDLRMSRSVNFNGNMNTYDPKTNNYFNIYGSFTETWNGFSTESFYDNTGITTSRPVNTDGNFSSNFGFNVGMPSKVKGLRFNYGLNGAINRNVNFINNNKNAVLRVAPGVSLSSSYDIDMLQLSLRTYTTYNNATNSFQHEADNKYYSFNNNATVSVKPVKSWRIYTDLSQSLYRGTPSSTNSSVYLWNAGVERYFMKSQNLTVALTAFDLLNQNSGIQRSLSTTGQITNTQTNTIGQYFFLKLTYKISKLGSAANKPGNSGIVIMR